jgi:hypothetical protein
MTSRISSEAPIMVFEPVTEWRETIQGEFATTGEDASSSLRRKPLPKLK